MRWLRRLLFGTLLLLLVLAGGGGWAVTAAHPHAVSARKHLEAGINGHLEAMRQRAAGSGLTRADRAVLHAGIVVGVVIGQAISPEGTRVLWHAVHGAGEPLVLDAGYFSQSPYLARLVETHGLGEHGPIWIRQPDDWRTSLAFNPLYLTVTGEAVRIWHPDMTFAAADGPAIHTVVPIGELRLQVPDNLVSALGAEPFEASAAWAR